MADAETVAFGSCSGTHSAVAVADIVAVLEAGSAEALAVLAGAVSAAVSAEVTLAVADLAEDGKL